MLRDAYCSTIVFITLIDGRLKLCSTLLPYKIAIMGSLVSYPSSLREAVQTCMQGIQFILPSHQMSALFVHYRWKINGSIYIMAAFHTQKDWVGCLLQPYHLKIFCGLPSHMVSMSQTTYRVWSLTVFYGKIVCYCAYVTVTSYCVLTLAHSLIS